MFKIFRPSNEKDEQNLINTLTHTLPRSFKVELVKDAEGEYKIYLEDREEGEYCKYSSGLTYIHNIQTLRQQYEGELQENIETPDWVDGRKGFSTTLYQGVFSYVYDKTTGTGKNAFDYTKPENTHSLFRVNWGGANSPSRGFITPPEFEDNLTFLKRAESNGGGRGLTYAIVCNELLNELESEGK